MLENQFIKIIGITPPNAVVPLPMPDNSDFRQSLNIFIDNTASVIQLLDEDLNSLYSETIPTTEDTYKFYNLWRFLKNAQVYIQVGMRYRVGIVVSGGYRYSQSLMFFDKEEFAFIRYRCNEDAFGFPFSLNENYYMSMFVRIKLTNPQNTQEDKTYIKANGEIVTLYAKYSKEWNAKTDFYSESWHDKIMAALSCDELYINETRLTKSENYTIDWENYDLDCDGKTKLAVATFKLKANTNQRNSNY